MRAEEWSINDHHQAEDYKSANSINTANKAAELMIPHFMENGEEKKWEEFWLLCLNNFQIPNCAPILISKGSNDWTEVPVKMIFYHAIKNLSSHIIVFHNHPSKSLTPSEADKAITKRIVQAGNLLEIKVNDHIIMAGNKFNSLRVVAPQCFF
jgi:DNA repair protein RadC